MPDPKPLTVAELAKLPEGSIIEDVDEDVWRKRPDGAWDVTGQSAPMTTRFAAISDPILVRRGGRGDSRA